MKINNKKTNIIIIIFLLLTVCGVLLVVNSNKTVLSDEELFEYYKDLYENNDHSFLENFTDAELNKFYENLLGPGNNDVTQSPDGSVSSTKTEYTYDDNNTYIEYLSRNNNKAYHIQDRSNKVTYNADHQGDLVSLITDRGETKFTYGIAIAGAAACFTYTDIVAQGYEKFSGTFGAHILARVNKSTSTSFNFRFVCDGVTKHTTKTFDKDAQAEEVEISLVGVEVFQIFVEIQGSGTGDYMGMGDPKFTKSEGTAYLDVFDLEFNLPSQVNDFNILEFAKAIDVDNNNISDKITYTTNYTKGSTGVNYWVEYSVTDSKGITRKQKVKMDVYNINYADVWTIEDYKTPFVNHLYQARQGYSPQMKKLFDSILDLYLDFDDTQWVKKLRSNLYPSQNAHQYNFFASDIYLTASDVNVILNGITDSEQRAIMILDVSLNYHTYLTTDSTTGLTSFCWFWAQNLTTTQYNGRIETILTNSEILLNYAKDDMTYAQKFKYVADAFQSRMTYTDGANLYNAVGLFKGKCNGNSTGISYLAQRLSIRSIYANGMSSYGFHAWTYQQLPDDGKWYLTDRLWGSLLAESTRHGHAVYSSQGFLFPTVSKTAYSQGYTYPSIWATFKNNSFNITQGETLEYSGLNNISNIDGIFNDILSNYTIVCVIKDENGNTYNSNTSKLSSGNYTIVYTLRYVSDLYDISRNYEIPLTIT